MIDNHCGIDTKIGDQVVYIGCNDEQINWGNNDDPRPILVKDSIYRVQDVRVHSQHTKLTLEGISGIFNSVCFSKLND